MVPAVKCDDFCGGSGCAPGCLAAGRWLDPPPIKSVCQSVLEQDIEP